MSAEHLPELLQQVEARLLDSLECKIPTVKELGKHVFSSGGKRMRPRMVLLACSAVGFEDDIRFNLAVAFELIHTATLIHDDIVDNSTQRRKRLSANTLWDNSTAVLSGDFLYSRAFELLAATDNTDLLKYISRITNLLAQGELMQLRHIKTPHLTEEQYLLVIRHKTAYLFEACIKSVSYLSRLGPELTKALAGFGLAFGEAFQMRDDYLDYLGSLDTIGKPPGGDLRDGKPTLPYIHALHQIKDSRKKDLLVQAISTPDPAGKNFHDVTAIIEEYGGFAHTRQSLEQRLDLISGHINDLHRLCSHTGFVDEMDNLAQQLQLPAD